jgi:6-phosphogluconolactonase
MAKLTLAADEEALARAAAERITTSIEHSIDARRSAIVCLTGGSTPRRLYTLLGDESHPWRNRIDWARLHLFWGDERHVPPDHRDSNFGMAAAALLARVPVPSSHVHRMRGELADATEAAREYEQELRAGFAAAGRPDITFDILLLGLGEDAHIASIFPESELLGRPVKERPSPGNVGRHVAAIWAPHLNAWRITMTPPALLDARAIVMVVAGEKKAGAVRAAIEGPLDVSRWPAQLLRQAGDRVEWMLDRAAAAEVRTGEGE